MRGRRTPAWIWILAVFAAVMLAAVCAILVLSFFRFA